MRSKNNSPHQAKPSLVDEEANADHDDNGMNGGGELSGHGPGNLLQLLHLVGLA